MGGSTLRPLGGYIADRLGGVRVLSILLLLIAGTYALASLLLPIGFTGALFIVGIAFLGMGNGAVFQLVPQRFQRTIGVATGLVGALGGIGGFVLPFLLGSIKQTSGSYAAGWITLAIFAFVVLAVLRLLAALRASWRSSWATEAESTEIIYTQASGV
ncbi:hypothetical protein [Ktedonobacter racemifer]|uniref:hypothetical protein n=1 Tax=Ktedonobacter racemifer TaxID=363277 RepID=UPI000698D999|nr:hypothetical protein [Ktedonobacter racemifer]